MGVKYDIAGLPMALQGHIESVVKTLNIFDVICIAEAAYHILLEDDAWLTLFLKKEIEAALTVDKDLFTNNRFLELAGTVKGFNRTLMRIMAEIYNKKIASQARELQDTIDKLHANNVCTPDSSSSLSLNDAPQESHSIEDWNFCEEAPREIEDPACKICEVPTDETYEEYPCEEAAPTECPLEEPNFVEADAPIKDLVVEENLAYRKKKKKGKKIIKHVFWNEPACEEPAAAYEELVCEEAALPIEDFAEEESSTYTRKKKKEKKRRVEPEAEPCPEPEVEITPEPEPWPEPEEAATPCGKPVPWEDPVAAYVEPAYDEPAHAEPSYEEAAAPWHELIPCEDPVCEKAAVPSEDFAVEESSKGTKKDKGNKKKKGVELEEEQLIEIIEPGPAPVTELIEPEPEPEPEPEKSRDMLQQISNYLESNNLTDRDKCEIIARIIGIQMGQYVAAKLSLDSSSQFILDL